MPPLVLASTSPYRRQLLARLGLAFSIDAPEVDETRHVGELVEDCVRRLALAKAEACARRHPAALLIGSDQLCTVEGEIRGKPGTREAAIAQLTRASGGPVVFHTAVALLDAASGRSDVRVVETTVHFRRLDAAEISDYVDRERPLDCAGAFRAEGLGIALFERIEGEDPNALIGLPLIALCDLLREAGCSPLGTSAQRSSSD